MAEAGQRPAGKGLLLYIRLLVPYTLGVSLVFLTFLFVIPLALYRGPMSWSVVSRTAHQAAASFWWILCFLGFAGGLAVHHWFQRGQSPFWWNQGLPLPLRLGALWGVHGALALTWELWIV